MEVGGGSHCQHLHGRSCVEASELFLWEGIGKVAEGSLAWHGYLRFQGPVQLGQVFFLEIPHQEEGAQSQF